MSIEEIIRSVQLAIKGRKLDLSFEKKLQEHLEKAFSDYGLNFQREFRLDEESIVDFMVESLAIEVKVKTRGSRAMTIYRQIERYAQDDRVDGILLMTARAVSMPEEVNGKPIYILSLGRTQL